MTAAERIIARDRSETESCERGTPGCAIDHAAEAAAGRGWDTECATW